MNTGSEIFIPPDNRMTATYELIGADNSDILAEIDIRAIENYDKDTEIHIRAQKDDEKETEINIMIRGNSDILVEIQPMGFEDILAEIEVRPTNRMWALYEVQEPPVLKAVLNPSKDTFSRSGSSHQYINYGSNNTIAVGKHQDEEYISFLEFNLSNWHPQFTVIDAKIRLHYSGIVPDGTILELFSVDEEWSERGLTHLNEPSYNSIIVNDYINYKDNSYIEIPITDELNAWINRPDLNNGFAIKASNGTVNGTIDFRSRETHNPPELVVSYYDTRIYSNGRSQTHAEIFVYSVGENETLAEIEVHSVFGYSDMLTELYVHRYEVPVPNDVETEITVSRLKTNSEITISLRDNSEVSSEVSVRSGYMSSTVDTEILVSKPYQYVELYVKHQLDLDAEIMIQRRESVDILAEVTTSRKKVDTEIYVKYTSNILAEIQIQTFGESNTLAEITVTRDTIQSEVYVKHRDDILSDITVQRYGESNTLAEITVTRNQIETELHIRAIKSSDINTEIQPRVIGEDDLLSEITVTREEVFADITVTYYKDIESEIYVKYRDDLLTELTVTVFDDVLTEIDVIFATEKDTEITVSRPQVLTEIGVFYWDDNDVITEIQPRVLAVNQVETEILVRDGVNAYAYII